MSLMKFKNDKKETLYTKANGLDKLIKKLLNIIRLREYTCIKFLKFSK